MLRDVFWLRDKGTCVFGKNSSEGFVQHAELLFRKNHEELLLVTVWHFLELHTGMDSTDFLPFPKSPSIITVSRSHITSKPAEIREAPLTKCKQHVLESQGSEG